MAKKTYFPNRNGDCVNSSLSNLLLILEDEETATKVQKRYREHRFLTKDNGVHIALLPRITEELTRKKYTGTLYSNLYHDVEKSIREAYGDKAQEALDIILEEKEAKQIMPYSSDLVHSLPIMLIGKATATPVEHNGKIVMLEKNKMHIVNSGLHCIVMQDKDTYINNGYIIKRRSALLVDAVFEVRKNE